MHLINGVVLVMGHNGSNRFLDVSNNKYTQTLKSEQSKTRHCRLQIIQLTKMDNFTIYIQKLQVTGIKDANTFFKVQSEFHNGFSFYKKKKRKSN